MKGQVAVLVFLLATAAQGAPIDTVLDNASHRLDVLWDQSIVQSELDWFDIHGEYAQCLHTVNVPKNGQAGPPKEEMPEVDREPHDRSGVTCAVIFGRSNIEVSLPFAIEVFVYRGSSGWGFVARIWVDYEGVEYIFAKNYGPETWRGHDWVEALSEVP